MILQLRLTNFRCHEDLEVSFGQGLQVVRGDVEAGKSSLLLAMLYFWFGARALPLPVSEMVTWGQPANSMRVDGRLLIAGQEFIGYRSPAGAELLGDNLRVVGQSEVTRHIEGLLGVNGEAAGRLLFARQKDLASTDARKDMELIEQLANFSLMDQLIERIQEKLPTGSTTALEAQIARAKEMVQPTEPDFTTEREELAKLNEKQDLLKDERLAILAEVRDLEKQNAAGTLRRLSDLVIEHEELARDERSLAAQLAHKPAPSQPEGMSEQELLNAQADEGGKARARLAVDAFNSLTRTEDEWEGTLASLDMERGNLARAAVELEKTIRNLQREQAETEARIVADGQCSFCGKDLSEVPEVRDRNALMEAKLSGLANELKFKETEHTEAKNTRLLLDYLQATEVANRKLAALHTEYIAPDPTSVIPTRWIWTGPLLTDIAPSSVNFQAALAAHRAYARAVEAWKADVAKTQAKLDSTQERKLVVEGLLATAVLEKQELNAKGTLIRIDNLRSLLDFSYQEDQKLGQQILTISRSVLEQETTYRTELAQYQAVQARLGEDQRTVKLMLLHNAVIKKIREARPQVANKLWATVNSATGRYFSEIRGVQSTVDRANDDFTIDGHPAKAFSGSTVDALGLAKRIALTKTFLPAIRFMVLDEPAAACDEPREQAMLATLATADFDQVIMVTHSAIADSFATNIIQL